MNLNTTTKVNHSLLVFEKAAINYASMASRKISATSTPKTTQIMETKYACIFNSLISVKAKKYAGGE